MSGSIPTIPATGVTQQLHRAIVRDSANEKSIQTTNNVDLSQCEPVTNQKPLAAQCQPLQPSMRYVQLGAIDFADTQPAKQSPNPLLLSLGQGVG